MLKSSLRNLTYTLTKNIDGNSPTTINLYNFTKFFFFLYHKPLAPVGFMEAKLDFPLVCYLA